MPREFRRGFASAFFTKNMAEKYDIEIFDTCPLQWISNYA